MTRYVSAATFYPLGGHLTTREAFGWTNASIQVGLALFCLALVDSLNALVRLEELFVNKYSTSRRNIT
jgi:hypothetical protein